MRWARGGNYSSSSSFKIDQIRLGLRLKGLVSQGGGDGGMDSWARLGFGSGIFEVGLRGGYSLGVFPKHDKPLHGGGCSLSLAPGAMTKRGIQAWGCF